MDRGPLLGVSVKVNLRCEIGGFGVMHVSIVFHGPGSAVWIVRVGGDDRELRPWHYIGVYSIESRLMMRVRYLPSLPTGHGRRGRLPVLRYKQGSHDASKEVTTGREGLRARDLMQVATAGDASLFFDTSKAVTI